jgi:hypothetical protein
MKSKGLSMITKIIEGKGAFLIMNTVDISEEVKVLKVITTHLSGVFKKTQSNSDDVKQGMMTWKS